MTDSTVRLRGVAPPPAHHVLLGQVRAWEELKLLYPDSYRRELAWHEEGPRAARDGWAR